MDIRSVLTYLTEKVADIPASPDNIHYTNFESLYYILFYGLKGQDNYNIKTHKTKDGDMELATARNSHKLTDKEKESLSSNANGGVKINLYTDRILAAHRNTKKAPIAELPKQRDKYIKDWERWFKEHYNHEAPKIFDKNKIYFTNNSNRQKDIEYIKSWLLDHGYSTSPYSKIDETYSYNRELFHLSQELQNREREERFILKKNIPVNQDFMQIVIEKSPFEYDTIDKDFIKDIPEKYLENVIKHEDAFLQNKKFREFKNYLKQLVKKEEETD